MENFKSGFVAIIGRTNVRKIYIIKFFNRRKNCSDCKKATNNQNTDKRNSK